MNNGHSSSLLLRWGGLRLRIQRGRFQERFSGFVANLLHPGAPVPTKTARANLLSALREGRWNWFTKLARRALPPPALLIKIADDGIGPSGRGGSTSARSWHRLVLKAQAWCASLTPLTNS